MTEVDKVCDVVIEGLPLGETDGLPLTERVPDTVEQMVGDVVTEDDDDKEVVAEPECVTLTVVHGVGE